MGRVMSVEETKVIFGLPFTEAMKVAERNKGKKPVMIYRCPECETKIEHEWYQFCPSCGQRFDWS